MNGIIAIIPEGGEDSARRESRFMKDATNAAGRSLR
jgi:hypothetical protein